MGVAEVVAMASAIIVSLCGVIAKLYRDRAAERARADALNEKLQRSHVLDLRRVAGLPTHSHDPPPPDGDDSPPTTRRTRR